MHTIKSNIENKEKDLVSGVVSNIKDNDLRKILFTKLLVVEKIKQFFLQKGLIIDNENPLFSNYQILKLVDITDIRINQVFIDLRIITTQDYPQLWIPKSHKELEISPDIYIAVKLSPDLTDIEFLGFAKNNDINTSCSNSKYVITDINKLKPFEEIFSNINQIIKPRIVFMNHEHEKAQELFLDLVEGELNQNNLAFLLKHLLTCEECRKIFKNFCNFDDFFMQMEIDKRDIRDLTLEIFTDNSILQGEEVQINTNEIKTSKNEVEFKPVIEPMDNVNIIGERKEKNTLLSKIKKLFIKKTLITENLPVDDLQYLQLNNTDQQEEEASAINDSFSIEDTDEKENEAKFDSDLEIDEKKSKQIDDLIAQYKSIQALESSDAEESPEKVVKFKDSIVGESLDLEKDIKEISGLEEINLSPPEEDKTILDNFELSENTETVNDEDNQEEQTESTEEEIVVNESFDSVEDTQELLGLEEVSLSELEESSIEAELDNFEFIENIETVNEEDGQEEQTESTEEEVVINENFESAEDTQELLGLEEVSLSELEESSIEAESDNFELSENAETVNEKDDQEEQIESIEEIVVNESFDSAEDTQELLGLEEVSLSELEESSIEAESDNFELSENAEVINEKDGQDKQIESTNESNNNLLGIDEEKSKQINDLIAEFKAIEASQAQDIPSSEENIEIDSFDPSENIQGINSFEEASSAELEEKNNESNNNNNLLGVDEEKSKQINDLIAEFKAMEASQAENKDKTEEFEEPKENNSTNLTNEADSDHFGLNGKSDLLKGAIAQMKEESKNEAPANYTFADEANSDGNMEVSNFDNNINDGSNSSQQGLLDLDDDKAKELDDLIAQFKSLDSGGDNEQVEEETEEPQDIKQSDNLNLADENQSLTPLEEINLNETDEAGSDLFGLDEKSDLLKDAIAQMKEEHKNEAPANCISPDQSAIVQNTGLNELEQEFEIDIDKPFEISDSFDINDSFSIDDSNESKTANDKDNNKGLLDIDEGKSKELDNLIAEFKSLDNANQLQTEESRTESTNNISFENNNSTSEWKTDDNFLSKELKTKKRYKFIKIYLKPKRTFKKLLTLMLKDSKAESLSTAQEYTVQPETLGGSIIEEKVELHERQPVKLKKKSNGPSITKIAIFLAAAGAISYVAVDNYPSFINQFKKDKNLKLKGNNKNETLVKKTPKPLKINADTKEPLNKKQAPVKLTKKENIENKKQTPAKLEKKVKIKNKSVNNKSVNLVNKQKSANPKKEVPVNLVKKQAKAPKAAVSQKKQTKLAKTKNNSTTIKKRKSIDNVLSSAFSGKSGKAGNSKIKISKVSWEIGASLAKDRSFKNYLVLTGNAFKTYLSDDLLWANDKATSDKVKLKIKLDLDGNLIKSKVLKSSGSKQIDQIILKSLNKTFNYTKLPKVNTNKEYINANIVINL